MPFYIVNLVDFSSEPCYRRNGGSPTGGVFENKELAIKFIKWSIYQTITGEYSENNKIKKVIIKKFLSLVEKHLSTKNWLIFDNNEEFITNETQDFNDGIDPNETVMYQICTKTLTKDSKDFELLDAHFIE